MNQSRLYLQPSLDKLRIAVLEQNRPGSVEGLLAHHVLKDDPRINIEWQVSCTTTWVESEFKPTNLDHVAALGYSFWAYPNSQFMGQLEDGLTRIRQRDAFKGEHLSLTHNPSRLLGIILGCLALQEAGNDTLSWCREVLEKMRQKDDLGFDPLVYYLLYRAFGTKIDTTSNRKASLYELCLRNWAWRNRMHDKEPSLEQLDEERQNILFQAATDLRFESTSQAAFIWSTVVATLFHALGEAALQARDVVAVLANFEAAMKRWRWDAEGLHFRRRRRRAARLESAPWLLACFPRSLLLDFRGKLANIIRKDVRKAGNPLILKGWLGGLDSNQDNQIQNLMYCQLYDLPTCLQAGTY